MLQGFPSNKLEPAEFRYHRATPYIRLVELKKQTQDLWLSFIHRQQTGCRPSASYLLDADLCVVSKNGQQINFEAELQKLEAEQSELFISFVGGNDRIPKLCLPPISYEKLYKKRPEKEGIFTDFLLGRMGFGRTKQAHKIESDTISKCHCKLWRLHSESSENQQLSNKLIKIFRTQTPMHSFFRKIPNECWQNIFSYLKNEEYYYIMDEGSRNGTYLYEIGTLKHRLRQDFEYEFNGEQYSIIIKKMIRRERGSIQDHNRLIYNTIEKFEEDIKWCSYHQAKKTITIDKVQSNNYGKIKEQLIHSYSLIIFKLKHKTYFEEYCLVGVENQSKQFRIGNQQDINTVEEDEEIRTLDGWIVWDGHDWEIAGIDTVQNQRHLWVRIPPMVNYRLSQHKRYQFRLAYTSTFSLQFYNF